MNEIKPKSYIVENQFELQGETKLPGEKLVLDDSTAEGYYQSGHISLHQED
jgi:hypothetical protein